MEPQLDFAEASSTSKNAALHSDDFSYLQLVYGKAGEPNSFLCVWHKNIDVYIATLTVSIQWL